MRQYRFCQECGKPLVGAVLEGRARMHCPECGFVAYQNPLPVVVAITVADGRFLLIKRGIPPKKGYWGCASGFIECGETPEEACLRELREETGVIGEIVRLVRVAHRRDEELYGDMLMVSYLVRVTGGVAAAGDEVDEVRFCSPAELPAYLVASLGDVVREVAAGA